MKTLLEQLENNLEHIFEAYDSAIETLDGPNGLDSIKCAPWNDIESPDHKEAIINWLKEVFGDDVFIIVSNKGEAFKIPRYLAQKLDSGCPNCIEVRRGRKRPTDRDIYYIGETKKKKIALTGSGSIGRVKTAHQELATCYIWNAFAESLKEQDDTTFKMNEDEIKGIIEVISTDFNKSWIKSFQEQISAILEFLAFRGISTPQQISQYRAARYGGTDYVDDDGEERFFKTGKAHADFVNEYMKVISDQGERVQKDNYDPSDILLYVPGEGVLQELNKMKSECKKLAAAEDGPAQIVETYRKLYNENKLFGLSLKQCTGKGSFELFNINAQSKDSVQIKSVQKVGTGENYTKLEVHGSFNFSGVPDPDGSGGHLVEDTVLCTFRSFGSANGMDVMKTTGPALGKVPARMWRAKLDIKETGKEEELREGIAALAEYTDKKHWNDLKELLQGGIKNGPWCLPFILIH